MALPRREMKGKGRAPILGDQHHVLDAERVEEGIEIAHMVEEAMVSRCIILRCQCWQRAAGMALG